MRRLTNLIVLVLALVVFVAALVFLLGNPEPVTLELFITDWRPSAAVGQLLIAFLLIGMLAGVVLGVLIAGLLRRRTARGEQS